MSTSAIINDSMTLEEKLQAIDAAMANAQALAQQQPSVNGQLAVPVDPADLTMCFGCQ